jgi:hypothetical protein
MRPEARWCINERQRSCTSRHSTPPPPRNRSGRRPQHVPDEHHADALPRSRQLVHLCIIRLDQGRESECDAEDRPPEREQFLRAQPLAWERTIDIVRQHDRNRTRHGFMRADVRLRVRGMAHHTGGGLGEGGRSGPSVTPATARVPCGMARRTLPRILASVRSAVLNLRWHRLCAEGCERDRASDTEMGRDDYLRIADEYRDAAVELLEEAVVMLRDADKRQLARWLSSRDPRVRQFVIEWMDVRG